MTERIIADAVVAEIGSTTTIVTAFSDLNSDHPRVIGQGQAATTVLDGDVCMGLNDALSDLTVRCGIHELTYGSMLATGSAAGGLRMSVHGLVHDMTVRAAEAAALGAGAIVVHTTSGLLTDEDIVDIVSARPNLLLLAGGTDFGERETAVRNMERIAEANLRYPVIYCGNIQNRQRITRICEQNGIPLSITENVYPRLDELNIEPVRRCIHQMFEQHIVNAPGMERIRTMVNGSILPTPGSVMIAAQLLYEVIGDLAVLDIGGATTDLHSVTAESDEIAQMQTNPEPLAKRTVEGDLGLFINARHLIDRIGIDRLNSELHIDTEQVMKRYRPVPADEGQLLLTERLCLEAGLVAVGRHAGRLRHLYTPQGRTTIAEGKDLSMIRYLIGTGGALTRLPHRESILRRIADCNTAGRMMLFPKPGVVKLLYDRDYIMASLGVLSKQYPKAAQALMLASIGYGNIVMPAKEE